MVEPFIGEIRLFAGNFAPRTWALCDGQLISVSSNESLFSLYGTRYGGDGRSTFGLPEMRGRVPLHHGNGPGLTQRSLGQRGGQNTVVLTTAEMPSHNHTFHATNAAATSTQPAGHLVADVSGLGIFYKKQDSPYRLMGTKSISNVGGSQAHENMMPYFALNFICSQLGVYPSRN